MSERTCEHYLEKFPPGVKVKNEERIKYMFSNAPISDKLEEWIHINKIPQEKTTLGQNEQNELVPGKNLEYSVEKREEGNVNFKKRDFPTSILCYNEALKFSTFPTKNTQENENAALCFANRSAAYYELGTPTDLQNSLLDTNYALKYGYPERLKIKIFLRQVNIYLKLENTRMARQALKEASMCQDIPKNLQEKINHLSQLVEDSQGIDDNQKSTTIAANKTAENLASFSFNENPSFAGASERLNLQYSRGKTRFVKSNTDLTFGDVVFLEEPFASILIPEFYDNHCYHCHCRLLNEYLFPCCHCSQIKFCSEDCYLKAWEPYHQYECGHLDLLQSVGIAHLAFRVLLTAGKDQVLKAYSSYGEDIVRDKSIFNKDQRPYSRVYSLLDHIDVMPSEDMFQYSLTASLLVNFLLKRTSFFNDSLMEDVYKVGGVLLKHICQLICNAHAITYIATDHELQCLSVTTAEESQVRIASAIYPSASMMNHSCDPNIASSFIKGRTLVVRVTTDLSKGSQIFNCYGPHVRRMRRETRQEHLAQQYFFNCDCSSCEKEAEDGFSFVDTFQALQCSKCSGPIIPDVQKQSFLVSCQDCGRSEDIEVKMRASLQVDQIISVAKNLLQEGRTADALEILSKGYELGRKHLFKFNSDYGQLCDMLGRSYAVLGNFDEAVPYVQKSINYVEYRFGETSIEYARELRKLCDLLKLCSGDKGHEDAMIVAMEKSEKILMLYENP